MNHVFFYTTWMARWTHGARMHYGKKAVWCFELCWETLGSAIHVDVILTCTTHLSIVADHVQYTLSWKLYSLMAVASFSRTMCPTTKQKWFRNGLRNTIRSSRCLTGLQDRLIHGGPTSQLTGLKGSAANVLVPDTTEHFQRSSGVHATMGQGCFGGKMGTYTIFGRWS